MKCKNCSYEFEKGKFCPECAFPIAGSKSPAEEAMELIKDTNTRLKKLEEEAEARKKAREKKKNEKEEEGSRDSASRGRGILDIF